MHNFGCPTPHYRLNECPTCWPNNPTTPNYSPWQQGQPSHTANGPTYSQAVQGQLRSPNEVQRPLPNNQRAQPERRMGTANVTQVLQTYQRATPHRPGPYSYAQVASAQETPSGVINSGAAHASCGFPALGQPNATYSNTRFLPCQASVMHGPSAQQITSQSYPRVQQQQRQNQGYPRNVPQLSRGQQLDFSTPSIPALSTSSTNLDPANVARWNYDSRVPGDRTIPRIDPASPAGPGMSVSAPHSPSETSSGNRRRGEEMYDRSFPFPCLTCSRTYNTQADLNHHIARVHSDRTNRRYRCPLCSTITFNSPRELRRHLAAIHDNPLGEDRHYCSYQGCDYELSGFVRRDHRDRHERRVHREDGSHPMSRSSSTRTSLAG